MLRWLDIQRLVNHHVDLGLPRAVARCHIDFGHRRRPYTEASPHASPRAYSAVALIAPRGNNLIFISYVAVLLYEVNNVN